MTHDELREALARKLFDISEAAWHRTEGRIVVSTASEWNGLNEAVRTGCMDMADECIRQMIWTHISAKWANPESVDMLEIEEREDGPLVLKLAPEGWKP